MRIAVDIGMRTIEDKVIFAVLNSYSCHAIFGFSCLYTKNVFNPSCENMKLNIFEIIKILEIFCLEINLTISGRYKSFFTPGVEVFGYHCTVFSEA